MPPDPHAGLIEMSINGAKYVGKDEADCMWEYLKWCGYPLDQEDHGRRVAQYIVDKRNGKK